LELYCERKFDAFSSSEGQKKFQSLAVKDKIFSGI
jgi:hypothetical protein